MSHHLYEKLSHTDLFKVIDEGNIKALFDNVAKVGMIVKNDNNFVHQVLLTNARYYTGVSKEVYVHWSDATKTYIDGILLVNTKMPINPPNTIDHIITNDLTALDFITFRDRITKAYVKMYQKHQIENNAEVELFSVLNKGQGIGKHLIHMWEDDLKHLGINEYFLSTNEMCTYGFYIHHGFKLIDDCIIDISELKHLQNALEMSQVKAMVYKKIL